MDVKGLLRLDVHSMAKVLRLPAVSSRLSPGAARPSTVPQTSLAGSVILPLEPEAEGPPTMLHSGHTVIWQARHREHISSLRSVYQDSVLISSARRGRGFACPSGARLVEVHETVLHMWNPWAGVVIGYLDFGGHS